MARVTVTNNSTGSYLVPAPIRKVLGGGQTEVYDGILFGDLEKSVALQRALADGTISLTVSDDPNVPDAIEDGVVGTTNLEDDAVTAAKLNWFVSAATSGTGSSQNVAHGLGVTPSVVIVVPVGGHDGAGSAGTQFPTIALGAHTSTNVVCTVSNGASFRVIAFV